MFIIFTSIFLDILNYNVQLYCMCIDIYIELQMCDKTGKGRPQNLRQYTTITLLAKKFV